MTWFRGQDESDNEFGEYLPDAEDGEYDESERLEANSLPDAKQKCKEIAKEYGSHDSEVYPLGKKWFDCRFKVWRQD